MGERFPAVRFEAEFRPTSSGLHYIAINGLGPTKLYIDDQVVISVKFCTDAMGVLFGGAEDKMCQYAFEAGKSYRIRLESTTPTDGGDSGLGAILEGVLATRLCFMSQYEYEEDLLSKAVEIAKSVDVVLAFVGNPSVWETEGRDQPTMSLPASGSQDRLIAAVAAVNPNIIVINSTGSPITMPWLSKVPAVVQTWFGGQESGNSIIDVLFGAVNPSGKLPVSFPKSEQDSASYGNFPGDPDTDLVTYKEGIKIGYRYFDEYPEKVAFPFGFGLSYTAFEIGFPSVLQEKLLLTISIEVRNVGTIDGSEVVQVYTSSPVKTVEMPAKELAAYAKVAVKAGGKEVIELQVEAEKLAYWDVENSTWVVEKGEYGVWGGNSSANVNNVGKFVIDKTFIFGP